MKLKALLGCLFMLLASIAAASCQNQAYAYTTRKAVYAGKFYSADKEDLSKTIAQFTRAAQALPVRFPKDRQLKALILPHAGYVYSGQTAAYASLVLSGRHFSRIIVMGPDHRIGFSGASVSTSDAYETPLGSIKLSEAASRLRKTGLPFTYNEASDEAEHSVEVVLPFLQTYVKGFSLVPVVMGPGDINSYVKAMEPFLDEKTLLVASSDLSHYLSGKAARQRDSETIDMIRKLEGEGLTSNSNRACGAIPIRVIIEFARRNSWEPVLLHYATSGEASGDHERVVGYASIAFFGGQPMEKHFTREQGMALVALARRTIQESLGEKPPADPKLEQALACEALKVKAGTFVTLTMNGQLRGCIGSLEGREPLVEGVRHNAINAAFRDPRFSGLTKKELNRVHVEVSVLTDPKPLDYTDYRDLLMKLRPGIDGVIIRQGYAGATFLPQVWEQLPDKEEFLGHLCMKAGLSPEEWKKGRLEVQTYQVQYFEEGK